jgi:hypothetical protein
MAIKLLVPWWTYPPGHVLDLGDAFDEKMIAKGKAEKVAGSKPKIERAVIRPKETRDGNVE